MAKCGKTVLIRNLVAVHAFQRTGAGRHRDRHHEGNKRACRGKVVDD